MVLDNHCGHERNNEWSMKQDSVSFHFATTSARWLNRGGMCFGIFSLKVLRRTASSDKETLRSAIEAYLEAHKDKAKPFDWKEREINDTQLKNSIANF